MPLALDIRKGNVINHNSTPCLILETHHRTPGKGQPVVQVKMRNLKTMRSADHRFGSTEKVEVLTTERKNLEFSYEDRGTYSFMDLETYDTLELSEELLGDTISFLVPNTEYEILFVDDQPTQLNLPSSVVLKVVESAEGIKGDTASNVQKPATLETGLVVQVPLFIKEGESIKVSTDDKSYQGRSS
ncbi:elongation factor P [Puniceicoccaceae bacterium K14]|nr:elongation factor P [Puniceicoccaceae bacterium K14]